MVRLKYIQLLAVAAGSVLMTKVSSCVPECEEPPMDGLFTITYSITEGGVGVFTTDDARNSLEVTEMKSGEKTTVEFQKNYSDQKFTNTFSIKDSSFDLQARDAMTCAEYILKYRTDDIDTLKVCYSLSYSAKCNSTDLDSAKVYWNNVLVLRDRYDANVKIDR